MERLRTGDSSGAGTLAAHDPRAFRYLLGRLWDRDPAIRATASAALGPLAHRRPELALEVVRRLVWALNDESGTNGVHGIAALAAIGAARPDLIAAHVGTLVSALADQGLRDDALAALEALHSAAPHVLAPHLDDLRERMNTLDGERAARMAALLEPQEGTRT